MAEKATLDTEIRKIILRSILQTARDIHHPQDDKLRVKRLIKTIKKIEEKCPEFDDVICDAEELYGRRGVFLSDLMLELKKLGSAHDDPNNIPGIKDEKQYNKIMHNASKFRKYIKKWGARFPALSSMLASLSHY